MADVRFEGLEPLLLSLDPSAVVGFFADLDEPDRRKLAPAVRKWVKGDALRTQESMQSLRDPHDERSPEEQRTAHDDWMSQHRRRSDCSDIALLATATFAELKKRPRDGIAGVRETTVDALIDRRPDWCGDYVDHLLSSAEFDLWANGPITWDAVRALIDAGLIDIPASRGLPELMVLSRVGGGWGSWQEPFLDRLLEQWPIAETVIWRIFSTPTPSLDGEDWREAVLALIDFGNMDRSRVIEEALSGLRRDDFRPKQLRWLLALLGDLQLTEQEVADRQREFADLLTTELPAIAATAITYLKGLDLARLSDPSGVLQGLSVSVLSKTKKTATASLDLAQRLRAAPEPVDRDVLRVAVAGIGHHDASIRARSVGLAAAIAADDEAAFRSVRAEIEDAVAGLPATEVAAAAERLGIAVGPSEDAVNGVEVLDRDAVESLPSESRQRWQVDEALRALGSDGVPPPLRLPAPSSTPAALGEPVSAVDDLAELAELIGHALEHGEDWLATECSLDGLSRHGVELRSLGKRYDALVRQAERVIKRWPSAPSRALARCLLRSAKGQGLGIGRPELSAASGLEGLTQGRAQEIGHRLQNDVVSPLLSVPSHANGWITPQALVDRVNEWPASSPITECDVVCALLRLHAVGASDALAKLNVPLATDTFGAVAYALGGEVDSPIASAILRVAAEDTRHRLTEDDWPDRVLALAVEETRTPRHNEGPQFTRVDRSIFEEPPPISAVPVQMPSVAALLLRTNTWGEDDQRWALSAAPSYTEAATLPALAASLHHGRWPAPVMLEPLLDGEQPLGQISSQLLVLAVSCDDATTRIAGRDVYIALIGDGRLDADGMAAVIATFITNDLIKTNRVVEELEAVSDASDLHGDEVLRLLDGIIARLEEPPSNSHLLLELANELHTIFGRAVSDDAARATLDRWATGSSRRAKAAKALLTLGARPSRRRILAAEARVMLRVGRAQRTATSAHPMSAR